MNTSPQPGDGEVHMYFIALPHHPSELSRLEHLLSTSETDRAGLLKNDHVKKRFIAGRGVLREILGGYLGVAPEKVRIATGEHGKPYLAECAENIRFNMSHTGDVLLLAVSASLEVGVDIETIGTDKPLNDIARIAFSLREQEELLSHPSAHLQTTAFYRCWVRKEACMKASGRGFSLPSNSFDVTCCNQKNPLLTIQCNQSSWHVLDIHVPQRYCAAIAVEARCSSLPPPKLVWVVPESLTEVLTS
jgi:4'-phosphopantetheinyl transferase